MAKKHFVSRHPWLTFFVLSTVGLCVYGELQLRSEKNPALPQ